MEWNDEFFFHGGHHLKFCIKPAQIARSTAAGLRRRLHFILHFNTATPSCSSQFIAFLYYRHGNKSNSLASSLTHIAIISPPPPSSSPVVYLHPNLIIPFRVQVEFYVNENTFKERLKLFFIKNQRSSESFSSRPEERLSLWLFSCCEVLVVSAFTWSAVDPCEWLAGAGAG